MRQTSETRSDGAYVFTPVRIGVYTIEAEFQGFQKARSTGVELNIQQQAVVNFSLTPGELTQTIEVEASAPLLQTPERLRGRSRELARNQ